MQRSTPPGRKPFFGWNEREQFHHVKSIWFNAYDAWPAAVRKKARDFWDRNNG